MRDGALRLSGQRDADTETKKWQASHREKFQKPHIILGTYIAEVNGVPHREAKNDSDESGNDYQLPPIWFPHQISENESRE